MEYSGTLDEIKNLMETQKWEQASEKIYEGLQEDNRCAELYHMLAKCKIRLNKIEQAELSFENALFFAPLEKREEIRRDFQACMESYGKIPILSIILVTYNQLEKTKLCVESIRRNNLEGSYEIIIVDNLSVDGTREWLKEQNDIHYILNEENTGFPAACNQGAGMAGKGNDIFLLNNDTILMDNSVYNLRMALYEQEGTGAAGSCSNEVGNRQKIKEHYDTIEEYGSYAQVHNAYSPLKHDRRLRLIGFAVMFRRDVWEQAGGFDERYGIGNYEDDDISIKILQKGYSLLFCRDSFIFHFGSATFGKLREDLGYQKILLRNRKFFEEKWKIRWNSFSVARDDLLEYIDEEEKKEFSILEIACGSGATLLEAGNRYENVRLYGAESDSVLASLAKKYLNIVQGDLKKKENFFHRLYDYIILGDVLSCLQDPEEILQELKNWLSPGGHMIISVPNIMHISVLEPLLHGRFTYVDEGIVDRRSLHFFTKRELMDLMRHCGLEIECMGVNLIEITERQKCYIERLKQMDRRISEEELKIHTYRLKVRRKAAR